MEIGNVGCAAIPFNVFFKNLTSALDIYHNICVL